MAVNPTNKEFIWGYEAGLKKAGQPVAINAGQVAYDDSASYTDGTVGGELDKMSECCAEVTADVSQLKSQITDIGWENSIIDFSDYDVVNGTIQADKTWAGFTGATYQSTLITGTFYEITVTPHEGRNSYISFFKSKPSQPASSVEYIDFCRGETGRHTIASGTTETLTVPKDCVCIVVTTKSNGNDYTPTIKATSIGGFLSAVALKEDIDGQVEVNGVFNMGYIKTDYSIGTTISLIPISSVRVWYSVLDCKAGDYIVISGRGGQAARFWAFVDENNVLLSVANEDDYSADKIIIVAPINAAKVITNQIASNMEGLYLPPYFAVGLNASTLYEIVAENNQTPFKDENRNLCLCAIKTVIANNKIPYHSGYLFHKLQNNDNTLWYGADFDHINKIGMVNFNPTLMRCAISPKDGRIIAVQRDTRNGIWVWDGTTETHLESFTTKPMAWLYNSGVDFIVDGNDVEHCIFAEYTSSPSSDVTLNVWRGTYPYTSASDWEIVLTQTSGDVNIGHFHMVRRDPWTDTLYLTSGDSDASSKWWYSTDYGENWTLLVSGSDTGWGSSLCRTINFIFTKDYVYWATDHAESQHTLNKIARDDDTGVLDLTTRAKLADLPSLYATNSLCYVESPNGLFMYDRIDTTSSSIFGGDVTMKFWSFDTDTLVDIVTLGLTENTWGGSRGKCYINYTNTKQTMPAMGFSIDTPCIFDLVCDNLSSIGTIAYDVGSKTVKTINY